MKRFFINKVSYNRFFGQFYKIRSITTQSHG